MFAARVCDTARMPSNDARRVNALRRSRTCSTRSPSSDGTTQSPTATSAPMLRTRSGSDVPRASNAAKFLYSLAHNVKPIIAAVDGVAIGIGTTMLFHCDYVLASKTATFSTPFINLGLVPEGASSLLAPRAMGHQRAFAMLVMGRKLTADDAHAAGFVNVVVAPGHTEAEARKVAREICALPAEAVAISRKLLKLPPEDMTRRIDQEGHLFGERMRSREAISAFQKFFDRKKG